MGSTWSRETDKDILESFGLAEEVKANKTNLKKYVGRTLAARVVKPWVEDFVDDATGEVVTVERTEVLIRWTRMRDVFRCIGISWHHSWVMGYSHELGGQCQ